MNRDYEYINVSKPRDRSPGLSHDLQLLRDMEIVNARTVAELGLLPLGGLPTAPRCKFIPMQPATTDTHGQANFENQEDETMRLNQVVVVTAMAGIAACEPSQEIVAAEQTQITAPAVKQAASVAPEIHAEPIVAAVSERATTDAVPTVPDEIRAFVPQDSTLLAYKRFDLTGDGNEDAVLVIRHPVTENYPEFSRNPCDLIVIHGEAIGFRVAAKGSRVVDCTYRPYAREVAMKPSDLNEILTLELGEIIVYEEADRPMSASTTYSFKYSPKGWHLNYAEAVFSRSEPAENEYGELKVYSQIAKYPDDLPFTPLSKFDPEDALLLKSMKNNQTEIK